MTPKTAVAAATPEPERPGLRWELPIWAVINCALASIPVAIVGESSLLLYAMVPALLLTITLLLVPAKKAGRTGVVIGIILIATSALSLATSEIPAIAIASMVLVLFLTSLSARPAGMLLGMLIALGYLIFTWLGADIVASPNVSNLMILGTAVASTMITVMVMMVTWWLLGKVKPGATRKIEESREKSGLGSQMPAEIARVLGPSNPMFRYAIVRAASFGIVMALAFSARGESGAFWMLLAMLIVGRPTGRAAWKSAMERVVATLGGVIVFLVAYATLPEQAMLALAAAILLIGLAWVERNNMIVLACSTVMVIAIAGAEQADYLAWAWARLIDTAIGSLIGAGVSMLGEAPVRNRPTEAQGTSAE